MPLILPPLSRRRWMIGAAAAGAALTTRWSLADDAASPSRVVLLADTHIPAERGAGLRGVVMADNLERTVKQILALEPAPTLVAINGDCAVLSGQKGDYKLLLELLAPVSEAGIPVFLALGNHDDRENCREALGAGDDTLREGRHATIVELPEANWFILDSLDKVNVTPGELGEGQLAWLARELDARKEKPAMIVLHHNPDVRQGISGLKDTRALLDVVQPRKQVKAWFFGHTHNWDVSAAEGLHLINQPPVAYVFRAGRPNGWLDVTVAPREMQLALHCLDADHAQHGERHRLAFRE